MLKQIQHKEKLSFLPGETSVTKNITLPIGFISHAVVYTNSVEDRSQAMFSLALKDDENIELVPAINIKNWKQRSGGTYLDSLKPLGFDTLGRNYKLQLTSDEADTDIVVEVLFFYSN